MSEPAGDQASPIQVLAKAVRVMDCFTVSSPVLHVSEVRERTGLPDHHLRTTSSLARRRASARAGR